MPFQLFSIKKRSPLNYKKTRSLCTEKGNRHYTLMNSVILLENNLRATDEN
ncbi:MAG: hypothetical protein KA717_02985 [Woronichinia naegeliana WA131]|uniref:Uncharacterized protein n=1 Tax=Woronichinia naegeliana WA131 TaxID=2824559 RepID=A0A977KXV4_9CYAN|nr:MAG: hypothetical protein KA717_02985 [Woronichinia naegeliana WA131]